MPLNQRMPQKRDIYTLDMTQLLPTTPTKPKSKRILELDAIRALSCLNLLLFHFTWVYEEKYGFSSPIGYKFPYGKYGVQLFFMLSGLVNAMTLLSKRDSANFISARWIRIFPSYWIVILMNVALFAYIPMFNTPPTVDWTVANLTTMPNLLGYENMEPVTWTLQVEMLFYIFLMLLLILGLLDKPVRTMMVAISICLILGTTFTQFKVWYPQSDWNSTFYVIEELLFIRTLPLFAMGILLNELRSKRGTPWVLWGGIVLSGIVYHAIDLREHNPLATILMFGLLTASAYGRVPMLRFQPLVYISFISYSLYLVHNNLGTLIMRQLELAGCYPVLAFLLTIGAVIGIAAAFTHWLEQPLTKILRKKWIALRKRFENRSNSQTAAPAKQSTSS